MKKQSFTYRFSIFIVLIALCFETHSQKDSVLKELQEFPMPVNILVLQTRNFIADKFLKNDINGVIETIQIVEDSIIETRNWLLTDNERSIIGLRCGNYKYVIEQTILLTEPIRKGSFFTGHDKLGENSYNWIRHNKNNLIEGLDNLYLSQEEKDFIRIQVEFLTFHNDFNDDHQAVLNDMVNSYLINHPTSPTIPYLIEVVRVQYKPRKMGFGFGIGGSGVSFTSELSTLFRNTAGGRMYFELSYEKFLFEYGVIFSSVRNRDSVANDKNVWRPGTELSFLTSSAHLGYSVYSNRYLRIVPSAGLFVQDYSFVIAEDKKPHEYEDTRIKSILSWSAGFLVDVKLGGRNNISPFGPPGRDAHYNLRLGYEYAGQAFGKTPNSFNGNVHIFYAAIGMYYRGAKRAK